MKILPLGEGLFQSKWCFLLAISSQTLAFYLPGMAPTSYKTGDLVPLHVNHVSPGVSERDAKVRSVFAFDYYMPQFHFCQPKDGPQKQSESIGSILFGDRILSSPFELKLGVNETCKAACGVQTFTPSDSVFVNERISQDYNINWLIDGLPAGQMRKELSTGNVYEFPGFPLGQINERGKPVLNNHYDILIDYHKAGEDDHQVVGVVVQPFSERENAIPEDGKALCKRGDQPVILSTDGDTQIVYTYSVFWRESSTPFANRWDKYLHVDSPRIHLMSLANSTLILCLLLGLNFAVLYRNLRRDITRHKHTDGFALEDLSETSLAEDGLEEDSGWKLLHGDVFRPPSRALLLTVLVANGVQLLSMVGVTVLLAMLGFLSPSNRGSLPTVMIILYTVFSFVGGFVSSTLYRFFHGDAWTLNLILTPLALPLVVFGTFFFLNMFAWTRQASGAVPFWTMLFLAGIWLVVSIPLSGLGSWLALKRTPVEVPTKTNQIPKQIPSSRGCIGSVLTTLLVGILPFGAIFVELHFILNSIWFSRFYYMFGFLFLCIGIMGLTCAAATMLFIYFSLCAENYHWQWSSFFASGASASFVFFYAMYYWMHALRFSSWTSAVLYCGYSLLIALLTFVLTGTIGFLAAWLFVLKIYRTIKLE